MVNALLLLRLILKSKPLSGTIYSTRLDLANISYLTIDGSTAPFPGIILDNRTSGGGAGPGGDVVSFDGAKPLIKPKHP